MTAPWIGRQRVLRSSASIVRAQSSPLAGEDPRDGLATDAREQISRRIWEVLRPFIWIEVLNSLVSRSSLSTAVKEFSTPYPLIDADPHFRRVVKHFRPSDYVAWAGAAAAFPGGLYLMEMFDPTRPKRGLGGALRLSTFLGAAGGFLFAYQRSSFRFWGWSENKLEQKVAEQEVQAAKDGNGPMPAGYGESDLSPYMQGVAARNSAYSQLHFSVLPWFNAVNHSYHGPNGVDFSKNDDGKEKEEDS